MNGDIDFESEENKGTTFYITFYKSKVATKKTKRSTEAK